MKDNYLVLPQQRRQKAQSQEVNLTRSRTLQSGRTAMLASRATNIIIAQKKEKQPAFPLPSV